jgi:hypothetical protein
MAVTRTAKRKTSRQPQPRARRTPARPGERPPPHSVALRPTVLDGVNRSAIVVRLKDVHGAPVADTVEFTLYNQRAGSLNQRFRVQTRARPVTLDSVPAFPFGVAEMFIAPDAYRFKQVFVNVPAGEPVVLDETLFIDPARAIPAFPTFADLQSDLAWATLVRVLDASGIRSEAAWKDGLDPLQKAGLLNLHAKLRTEVVGTGESLLESVVRVTEFRPERIYAEVASTLYDRVRELPHVFRVVSGRPAPLPGRVHQGGAARQLQDLRSGGEPAADVRPERRRRLPGGHRHRRPPGRSTRGRRAEAQDHGPQHAPVRHPPDPPALPGSRPRLSRPVVARPDAFSATAAPRRVRIVVSTWRARRGPRGRARSNARERSCWHARGPTKAARPGSSCSASTTRSRPRASERHVAGRADWAAGLGADGVGGWPGGSSGSPAPPGHRFCRVQPVVRSSIGT